MGASIFFRSCFQTYQGDKRSLKRRSVRLIPHFKVWLTSDDSYILGEGSSRLLRALDEYGTIREAAIHTKMSYKYAWKKLTKIEKAIGKPVIKTRIGGREGGGTELTESGEELLRVYDRMVMCIEKVTAGQKGWLANH